MRGPEVADALLGGGELGACLRALDWDSTALGPVERWPQSLRTAVSICLGSRFPMLVLWGPEYVAIYNDGYAPMLGAKHPAAIGRALRQTWPEVWDVIGPMLDDVRESGVATWQADQRLLLHRNGFLEEGYFSYSFGPARGEHGTVDGIFTAVIETTQRVVGERRLRLLKDLAECTGKAANAGDVCALAAGAIAAAPDDLPFAWIYLLGDEGRTHLAGSAGAAVAPAQFDPGAALPPDRPALAVPIATPGDDAPLGMFVAGLNPHRPLDTEYRGFLDLVAGQIGSAIVASRTLEAARARAEALAEIDRAKTVFFSNISHEFRTPLTLMAGPIEDLIAAGPPEVREPLLLVQRNVARLLRLVNALLDFSRAGAGRLRASYAAADLGTLTADIASAFRPAVERAGLRFVVEAPPLAPDVYVDRDLWETALLNLLSNAVKFTSAGEIAVRVEPRPGGARLIVADTGVGIPADHLPRIFERFHRVPDQEGRTQEGAGIGLALVQEIARLHGATIEVRSRVGEGTTVSLDLVSGPAHLPADHIVGTPLPRQAGAAAAFGDEVDRWLTADGGAAWPAASDSGGHVLVADDNADMRRYLARTLSSRWRVTTCATGREALARARDDRPDLLVTDVMMPEMDGFALLKAVRADASLRALPVIMVSARAGAEAVVEGLSAGADDYLVKPFSSRELIARVGTQIELNCLRRDAETASRAKDEFLAMLGHELRNPLAPILTAVRLMRLRGDGGARECDIIERQTTLLVRIVDDLLDVSRAAAGKLVLQREPLEMSEVAAKAIETAMPTITQHGHQLDTDLPRGLIVDGDASRLSQVVANLLTNAAKYTPSGGRISIAARRDDADVIVTVADTGIGLSPEMLPRVFDLFAQDRDALARAGGGLGLGLAIARNLVRLHGGHIEARSAGAGHGSEFLVRLPAAKPGTD